jgi:hypothetical protein
MELALVVVLGVPLARLLPNRRMAWLVLAAVFLVVLPFRTASVHDEGHLDAFDWPMQVVIAGLVALGAWWRVRRDAPVEASVVH